MRINIQDGLCEYFTVSRVLLVQLLYTEDENVRELYLLSPDAQDRSRECSYRLIIDYVLLDLFKNSSWLQLYNQYITSTYDTRLFSK